MLHQINCTLFLLTFGYILYQLGESQKISTNEQFSDEQKANVAISLVILI